MRESTLAVEGPLRVSKALKIPLLLDAEEMEELLAHLNPPFICSTQIVKEPLMTQKTFLALYREYVEALKAGRAPNLEQVRIAFSTFWSASEEQLYQIRLPEERFLIKATAPVIQLQPHSFHYSKEDHSFRSQLYGPGGVTWGLLFSYPQLFQDPKTQEIVPVDRSSRFPTSALFHTLQQWVRRQTLPTPFVVEGKKVHVPIRLGKRCLTWISQHRGLEDAPYRIAAPEALH